VQGDGSAEEIAKAIRWVDRNHKRLGVDAMLVTRGGGSIEDLSAFNERVVADAVFRAELPVVAAIGHESDTTVVELVADVRCSTPTQAAMRLVPSAKELSSQVGHHLHRLGMLVRRGVEHARQNVQRIDGERRRIMQTWMVDQRSRLERTAMRLQHGHPGAVLARQRTEVNRLATALHQTAHRHIRHQRERLAGAERHLAAVDPHGVLRRGYSLTTNRKGVLIRSVHQVKNGDVLVSRVADGSIDSVVAAASRRPAGKVNKKSNEQADQLDLFAAGDGSR
jgi:exodeoxyribonuclease VII large subunit